MKCANVAWAVLLCVACSNQTFDLPPEQQDFSQSITYNNKVDILLMVDNSSSMLQYQNRFALQVPAMINRLNQLALDYHIGVTTSDMRAGATGGTLLGTPAYLTSNTPNLIAQLQSRITVGQAGSDLERGIQSVYTVLQPGYLSGPGAGFLRDDSLLVFIFLTNEDDYSNTSYNYKAYFDKIRPPYKLGQRSWIANFIGVVSIDGECQTTPDFKEAGLKYMALADASGGRKESICKSDFATAVSNIQARIAEYLTDYPLKRRPVIESIRVTINGVEIPNDPVNGWTYDEDGNFIRFHGLALPGATDHIIVDYQPLEGT